MPTHSAIWMSTIDDHSRPLPGPLPNGWFYNASGGDRGLLNVHVGGNSGSVAYSATQGSYKASVLQLEPGDNWTAAGFWYSLFRPLKQKTQYPTQALYPPIVRAEFQPKVEAVHLDVKSFASPNGRSDISLAIQLKGFDSNGSEYVIASGSLNRATLLSQSYPKRISFAVPNSITSPVGLAVVILDRAVPGDELELDGISVSVSQTLLDPTLEPVVWTLGQALTFFDFESGLLQDRAQWPDGDYENISATGKLAKNLALLSMAHPEIVDVEAAKSVVRLITDRLLALPRGPSGLWPHWTIRGGTVAAPEAEYASGDTAYALLDLLVASRLISDAPRETRVLAHIKSISWSSFHRNGHYSHGYYADMQEIPWLWQDFGMETIGVACAALIGGGPMSGMLPPPAPGPGFIPHAAYPLLGSGIDRWGNNWEAIRSSEVKAQVLHYAHESGRNTFYSSRRLFGLSASETPEANDPSPKNNYMAYGIAGSNPLNDGGGSVMVPHYSGMVAPMDPQAALDMWKSMKTNGLASPLNVLESIRVEPGESTPRAVNWLKGGWNMMLFLEGWVLADPAIRQRLQNAVESIPDFFRAWSALFPPVTSSEVEWLQVPLPGDAGGQYQVVEADGLGIVVSRLWDSPRVWTGRIIDSRWANVKSVPLPVNLISARQAPGRWLSGIAVVTRDGERDSVFVAGLGGVYRFDPIAESFTPHFDWNWDPSVRLLARPGGELVWEVTNFGSKSGYFSELQGVQTLSAYDVAFQAPNQIIHKVSKERFGWRDARGFLGTQTPKLLFDEQRYSTDFGSTWTSLNYTESPDPQYISLVEEHENVGILIVSTARRIWFSRRAEDAFREIPSPEGLIYEANLTPSFGMIHTTVGEKLFSAKLPSGWIEHQPQLSISKSVGNSLALNLRVILNTVYWIEASTDLITWSPLAEVSAGGASEITYPLGQPTGEIRYYRARVK